MSPKEPTKRQNNLEGEKKRKPPCNIMNEEKCKKKKSEEA